MQRRRFIKAFALSAAAVGLGLAWSAQAADTIKVGILSSLSGTMAISETPLKDVAPGQGGGGVRLLDLGVAQVGAAGV